MIEVGVYPVEQTPKPFLALAWDVFFAARGRGVSWDAHFPWMRGGGNDDRAFCIAENGRAAAMLVMRRGVIEDGARAVNIYAIGLVCTAPDCQRRGLASRVLTEALDAAGSDAPILLWTSRDDFYARFGFVPIDPTLVVDCSFPGRPPPTPAGRAEWRPGTEHSPLFGGHRGLPAFAKGACRLFLPGDDEKSFVLTTSSPPALLEMEVSSHQAAAAGLAALGSDAMVLNLPRRVPLLDRLEELGARLVIRPTSIAMWRPGRCDAATIMRWDIPLLDRF